MSCSAIFVPLEVPKFNVMGTKTKRKLQSAFHILANSDTISLDDHAAYIEFNIIEYRKISLKFMGFEETSEPTIKELLERFDALRSQFDMNSFEYSEVVTAFNTLIEPRSFSLTSPTIKWSKYHEQLAKRFLNISLKEKLTIEKLETAYVSIIKSIPFSSTYYAARYAFMALWTELDLAQGHKKEELKHLRSHKRLEELEEPFSKLIILSGKKNFQRLVLFDVKNNTILEQSEDVANNANQEAKENAMQQFELYGLKSPFTVKDLDAAYIKADNDNFVLPKGMKENYRMLALTIA